jgi:hypothetical protein
MNQTFLQTRSSKAIRQDTRPNIYWTRDYKLCQKAQILFFLWLSFNVKIHKSQIIQNKRVDVP